jgi:hypothetical protein
MQIRSPSRLLALLLTGAAIASWHGAPHAAETAPAPPPWPASKDSPFVLAADPVRPLLLGPLRVTLDGSTLAATRLAIGIGASQRQGGGTDALDWLCYTLSDAAPAQRLWLTSSELSRGRIDAVVAADLPGGAAATAQCPELPPRFRPVRFDDGLWLGGLSGELRRALGIPARGGPHFSSLFQGQSGNLTMVSSTVIEFRGARAVTLHVAHSSQN